MVIDRLPEPKRIVDIVFPIDRIKTLLAGLSLEKLYRILEHQKSELFRLGSRINRSCKAVFHQFRYSAHVIHVSVGHKEVFHLAWVIREVFAVLVSGELRSLDEPAVDEKVEFGSLEQKIRARGVSNSSACSKRVCFHVKSIPERK